MKHCFPTVMLAVVLLAAPCCAPAQELGAKSNEATPRPPAVRFDPVSRRFAERFNCFRASGDKSSLAARSCDFACTGHGGALPLAA